LKIKKYKCGVILLTGFPNAGKSTLLNNILNNKISIVSHKVQTTKEKISGVINLNHSQLIFTDTPGIIQNRKYKTKGLSRSIQDEEEKVDLKANLLECLVTVGGVLSNNKGVNFPDVQLSVKALTEKDKEDLKFGLSEGVDWIALSFVRNPSDINEIKNLIIKNGHSTPVVAKIEKFEAIDQIDTVLPLCDGVMVARGDLGVEMPAEEVPLLQKELIRKANSLGIPIITATQMLDSMASNPRPTRAEVSDVANAILDGTDAVMLTNETAVGDYPVEAVETMATIARRIERDYPLKAIESHLPSTIPNAISAAVSNIARQLDARAIIPLTKSGSTARNVSKFRPPTPILATTTERSVARRLQLVWGVTPIVV